MNVAHYEAPIFGRMLPAMVTPFDDALELDIEAVQTLADSLIVQGADGLVIGATTGESPTLTEREKKQRKAEEYAKMQKAMEAMMRKQQREKKSKG